MAPHEDIEFTSRVEADRLRFREPPETDVRFHGTPGRTSISRSERRNLPERVTEASEHRDVRIDYLLASRLGVSEAAGEEASESAGDQRSRPVDP